MRYELTEGEWGVIKPMLPNKPRGVPRVDDRRTLNGIFWVLRSGAPWRDLPRRYGPHTTCYNRFIRWREAGVWDGIMAALTVAAAHDAAMQVIDTSIVRVHQHGACIAGNRAQHMGRSRGGLTTKIHAVVDGKGLPVQLGLTAGEAHDNRLCTSLVSGLRPQAVLLADRGYDADWIRRLVAQHGAWANIPPKCNRKEPICSSPYLYRERAMAKLSKAERSSHRKPVDIAPALPPPKAHSWNSLVYLHGKLEHSPGNKNLILTTADFGAAYWLDHWAGRFVTELFRNFHVVFIGYRIEDPMMRYLVTDASAQHYRPSGHVGAPMNLNQRGHTIWSSPPTNPPFAAMISGTGWRNWTASISADRAK